MMSRHNYKKYLKSVSMFGFVIVMMFQSALEMQGESTKPLVVEEEINLQRYCGTWYEIARLPNPFQKKCMGNVSATYALLEDGTLEVINRCRKQDGSYVEAVGRAKRARNDEPNSKLKVRFAPDFLSFLPFVWGDYWIIDLASDYSYVAIGEPQRRYFWVLARQPVLDDTILQSILDRARQQGYDLTELILTVQIYH